jgi:hypothetical protein
MRKLGAPNRHEAAAILHRISRKVDQNRRSLRGTIR